MKSLSHLLLAALIFSGCSQSSSFSGSAGKKKIASPVIYDAQPDSLQTNPLPTMDPIQQLPAPTTQPLPAPTVQPPPVLPIPIEIVDGNEVFNSCAACLSRAQALAPSLGFAAHMSRTVNHGYYKINPNRGLCDIHFMDNLNDPGAIHNGVDSTAPGQVILYCPCNCSWQINAIGGDIAI